MATMCQTWSIFTVVLLLAVQLCVADKYCTIWSSVGPVVQRETSFTVYCSFNCKCKGHMDSGHPPKPQSHMELNSTTIYFNVVNITKNWTYSCHCKCITPGLDSCGLDISTGYPPDRPKNITCIYKVKNKEHGDVFCTWNRGRDTYLLNSSMLGVRIVSRNDTDELKIPIKGTDSPSGSFPVSTSVQFISVWVYVENLLNSTKSSVINYTLSDIAMPPSPELVQPECSSRDCNIKVKQSVRTNHLEIQYTAGGQTWTTYPDQCAQMTPGELCTISSLEPYTLYHFRAKTKFSTGLWSEWSTIISCQTQEEAPKKLDVWYAEPASDLKSLKVYWKLANISRGKITGYEVRVYDDNHSVLKSENISGDARNHSVPFCANCEVKVWARNSKGLSPPAKIKLFHTKAKPPQDVQKTEDNHSVTLSWGKPETTLLPAAYVVEWYPEGHKLEELRWVRLSGSDSQVVITDMKAFECYEGAVYVFYDGNSVNRATFSGVSTQKSVPAAAPTVKETVEGNKVIITWTELHRALRMGCITNYTIYLESDSGHLHSYSVPAEPRIYVIENMSPGSYSLWMTASTAVGKGSEGVKVKIFIQQSQLSLLLVCGVIFIILFFLVCLCQCSAVKQRFWLLFQCLMLDVVPDPANSKWAKECIQEQPESPSQPLKMNLQVQLSNSSATKEEEEPILVEVEELPKQTSDTSTPENVTLHYPSQSVLSPETELPALLYPLTTYIKSLSHDSNSSDHTETSLDTNSTVDYISSHGPGNMDEEDQEEEEFSEVLDFFPSHNVFMEQLDFRGKLTLDAVKIDCSDFFQNI